MPLKGCPKECARDNPERQYGIWSIRCSWHRSCRIFYCCFPLALANIRLWPLVPFLLFRGFIVVSQFSILSSVYSIKTDLAEMAETTLKIGGCTYPELQKRSVKPRLYWLRDQFHETQTEVPLFCLMKQAETLFWPECVLSHRCYRKDASVGTVSFLFLIAWQKISFQDRQLIKTLINLFAADTPT